MQKHVNVYDDDDVEKYQYHQKLWHEYEIVIKDYVYLSKKREMLDHYHNVYGHERLFYAFFPQNNFIVFMLDQLF